jgi:hypothetical protein
MTAYNIESDVGKLFSRVDTELKRQRAECADKFHIPDINLSDIVIKNNETNLIGYNAFDGDYMTCSRDPLTWAFVYFMPEHNVPRIERNKLLPALKGQYGKPTESKENNLVFDILDDDQTHSLILGVHAVACGPV